MQALAAATRPRSNERHCKVRMRGTAQVSRCVMALSACLAALARGCREQRHGAFGTPPAPSARGRIFMGHLSRSRHTHSACSTVCVNGPHPSLRTDSHATASHPAYARNRCCLRRLRCHRPQRASGQPSRRRSAAGGTAHHRSAAGIGRRAGGAIACADAGKSHAGGGQRQHQAGGAGTQPVLQRPVLPPPVPGHSAGADQRVTRFGRHHRCHRRPGADQPPRHRQRR
ncbi:hypothetical protein D3C73_920720 [compost metagenome]